MIKHHLQRVCVFVYLERISKKKFLWKIAWHQIIQAMEVGKGRFNAVLLTKLAGCWQYCPLHPTGSLQTQEEENCTKQQGWLHNWTVPLMTSHVAVFSPMSKPPSEMEHRGWVEGWGIFHIKCSSLNSCLFQKYIPIRTTEQSNWDFSAGRRGETTRHCRDSDILLSFNPPHKESCKAKQSSKRS